MLKDNGSYSLIIVWIILYLYMRNSDKKSLPISQHICIHMNLFLKEQYVSFL